MPNSSNSNKSSNAAHSVIIALAFFCIAGFLVLFYRMDLNAKQARKDIATLSQQINQIQTSEPKTAEPQKENLNTATWKTYSNWDLSFKYPPTWEVVREEDAFSSNKVNLVITSQEGRLRLGGGPGQTGIKYFEEGFEAIFTKLEVEQQAAIGKTITTQYPKIKKDVTECDGAGCPDERYYYEGKDGVYELSYWSVVDVQTYEAVMAAILSTISEK